MRKKRILVFFIIILIFSIIAYIKKGDDFETSKAKIINAVDGDTVVASIEGKDEKIRLKGINTPEKKENFYNEAKDFLSFYNEKEIVLRYDKYDKEDKYGRILGYIFYNNELINKKILEKGMAHTFYYAEDKYTDLLIKAEKEAMNKELGIWKKSPDICADCVKLEKLDNGIGKDDCKNASEFILLKNICEFDCSMKDWKIKDEATHIFILPNYILKSGRSVWIYNGVGINNETALFFGNKGCASVWNDERDSFFLRDNFGLIIFYRY